jgi:putative oxidoreductase
MLRPSVPREGVSRAIGGCRLALRMCLGILFIYSGLQKSNDPRGFLDALYAYQIVGRTAGIWVVTALSSIELVAGLVLVMGVFTRAALLVASCLLLAFSAAIGFVLLKGLNIPCGCFELSADARPMDIWTLARTLLLFAFAAVDFASSLREVPRIRMPAWRRRPVGSRADAVT